MRKNTNKRVESGLRAGCAICARYGERLLPFGFTAERDESGGAVARGGGRNGNTVFLCGFRRVLQIRVRVSQTKVSNLVRIAEFVQVKGDSVNFIERKYADYSMSQLVELASVPKENRKYFNADMTVDDMRAVKNYMRDSVGFIYMEDSEAERILEKAKKFRAEENAKRAEQKERRRQIMRGNRAGRDCDRKQRATARADEFI